MKRLAFYAVVIVATLAFLILLWQFRSAVILLLLSLVLTAALRPSVDYLESRGLRPGLARVLIYLAVFGSLALALFLIAAPLLAEFQGLSNFLVVLYDFTYRSWSAKTGIQQAIVQSMPAPGDLDQTMAGPAGAAALNLLFGVTQSVATVVAGLVIVIVLSLYWSADRSHFERLWLSLLPAGGRIRARRIWRKTEGTMGAYLRSEFIQTVLAVVLLSLGYWIIGSDYPILTGLLAGVAWVVPMVGFVVAALISFMFGLASSGGLFPAVASLVMTIAVLVFLEFYVEPHLFRRHQFSGVLIVLFIAVLVDAYGVTGFIIAPPLAVATQVLLGQFIEATRRQPAADVEIDTIEQRLAAIRERYEGRDEEAAIPPEIASLIGRLDTLVGDARKMGEVRD